MGCSVSLMSRVLLTIADEMAADGQKAVVRQVDMQALVNVLGQFEKVAEPMTAEEKAAHQKQQQEKLIDVLEEAIGGGDFTLDELVAQMGERGFELTPQVPKKAKIGR